MSYDLLIHEYLDSGLDETSQEALFAEIARNPELRNEFNSQLKLQNIAKMDLNSISTPPQLTSNIFGELGFSVPSKAEKTGFWSRLNTFIVAALLGLALGSGLFYGLYSTSDLSNSNNIAQADKIQSNEQNLYSANQSGETDLSGVSQGSQVKSTNDLENSNLSSNNKVSNKATLLNSNSASSRNSQVNSSSSRIIENNTSSINSKSFDKNGSGIEEKRSRSNPNQTLQDILNKKTYRSNFITSSDSKRINNLEFSRNVLGNLNSGDVAQSNIDSWNYGSLKNDNSIQNQLSAGNFSAFNTLPDQFFENQTSNYSSSNPFNIGEDETRWAVGIRQINQIDVEPIVNNENSFFLNRSVFVNYKLSPNISLVGEFGAEKFIQEYEQIIAGTDVQTTQNPLLAWYGIGAKFRANGFLGQNFIVPYVQTIFAANSIGPVLRPTLGLDFRVSTLFTITTSYDRPILFYSVFGENLRSSKNGFTFGINVNL